MSDLLTKKKKVVVEQVPVFDHSNKDIGIAIGVPGLIQGISDKINQLITNQTVTSPSKAVEYFYNNFSLIELAFMAMHSLGHAKDEPKEDDGAVEFEEVG
jgi:hypothetical protein